MHTGVLPAHEVVPALLVLVQDEGAEKEHRDGVGRKPQRQQRNEGRRTRDRDRKTEKLPRSSLL